MRSMEKRKADTLKTYEEQAAKSFKPPVPVSGGRGVGAGLQG